MNSYSVNSINLGIRSNKVSINIVLNKQNKKLCSFLFNNNMISSYHCNYETYKISVFFSSFFEKQSIRYIKQVSRPSRPVHISYKTIKQNKDVFFILSTSKGLINTKEALIQKTGGELLFIVKC